MGNCRRPLSLSILACLLLSGVASREAVARGASKTKGPFNEYSQAELRTRKLLRGVANIGLSVAEVPNQAFREAYRTSSPITGALVGAVKGVVKGVKRILIGSWEIATFYAPMKNNYEPYIEPEVVFMEYLD